MKTKKVKARKVWESSSDSRVIIALYKKKSSAHNPAARFVLPASRNSIEEMVAEVEFAISMAFEKNTWDTVQLARAALSAIGIHSRAPKSALPNA